MAEFLVKSKDGLTEAIFILDDEDKDVWADGGWYLQVLVSGYRRVVRVRDGDFENISHAVWEKHYGPVPSGYHVHHRNNKSLDNRLQNLDCITAGQHRSVHNGFYRTGDSCIYLMQSGKYQVMVSEGDVAYYLGMHSLEVARKIRAGADKLGPVEVRRRLVEAGLIRAYPTRKPDGEGGAYQRAGSESWMAVYIKDKQRWWLGDWATEDEALAICDRARENGPEAVREEIGFVKYEGKQTAVRETEETGTVELPSGKFEACIYEGEGKRWSLGVWETREEANQAHHRARQMGTEAFRQELIAQGKLKELPRKPEGEQGVYYRKDTGTWRAKMQWRGKAYWINNFRTKEEALVARHRMEEVGPDQAQREYASHR